MPAGAVSGRGAWLSFHGRDGGGGGRGHHCATRVATLVAARFCRHRAVLLARRPETRLAAFPTIPSDPRTIVGSGLMMVAALWSRPAHSASMDRCCSRHLHGLSPLTIGLIIASESVSWSLLSITVANAPARREPFLVTGGALMVTPALPALPIPFRPGSFAGILFCALLQGGGFGIIWPFASRRSSKRPRRVSAISPPRPSQPCSAWAMRRVRQLAGMIANASGFSGGFTREAAQGAASILFLAFVPLALLGCLAAWRSAGFSPEADFA